MASAASEDYLALGILASESRAQIFADYCMTASHSCALQPVSLVTTFDGQYVYLAVADRLEVYSLYTTQKISQYLGHKSSLTAVVWHPFDPAQVENPLLPNGATEATLNKQKLQHCWSRSLLPRLTAR